MNFTDDDAVTPVVGTVLVLLITMAGIGGVLAWGVPSVQAIQDQSSMAAMQGEFSDLRLNTIVLREVDTSRLPQVTVNSGEFGLEPGGRFAIHAMHNDQFPDNSYDTTCDVRVTGWSATSDTLFLEEVAECGDIGTGPATAASDDLEIVLDKLVGSSIQSRPSITVTDLGGGDWSIESTGDDFSTGAWRLRLNDADNDPHVQVFILETDRLAWHLETSVSDLDLYVEGGAIFQVDSPFIFNLAGAPINEDVFGTSDYLINFITYTGDEISVGAPSSPDVFLKLLGNHARVSGLDTLRLRYDVSGDLGEAWCNYLVFRTDVITAGNYTADASATCDDGDADGVRSVVYEPTVASFPFELIQKRVHAGIIV